MKNSALLYSFMISLGFHAFFFTAGLIKRKGLEASVSFKQGPSSIRVKLSSSITSSSLEKMGRKKLQNHKSLQDTVKKTGVLKGAIAEVDVAPEYPSRSILFEEEGIVTIAVEIDRFGRVKSAVVEKSSGHVRLDNAALEAAKKTFFTPATLDGDRVESRETLDFKFKLK